MEAEEFYEAEKNNIKVKQTEDVVEMHKQLMCKFAEAYHEHRLKLLDAPPVSKCEWSERRDLLLAFKDYLNKNRIAKYTEAVVDNFISQQ